MNAIGDLFNLLLLAPLINLIIVILNALEAVNIPGALGFAIIILTALITLVTWPFRSSQLKSMKKTQEVMALLQPEFDRLKEIHKGDNMAFNQAKAKLMQEKGVNPAAGCLPALIPIILIFPLYQVIFAFFEGARGLERINYFAYSPSLRLTELPDLNFLGFNLAAKPSEFAQIGAIVLLVPLITALLTLVQSLMMTPKPVRHYKTDSKREVTEKEKSEDMASAMQKQMMYMMPIMFAYFAFTLPIGLAIYWNTLTILGIVQQYTISGWGRVGEIVKKIGFKK